MSATPKGGGVKTRPTSTSANTKTASALPWATVVSSLYTESYSGACKINARPVSRASKASCGQQMMFSKKGKSGAAPPTPRENNADADGVDLVLQNKRSFLFRPRGSSPFSIVQRGAGGGARNLQPRERHFGNAHRGASAQRRDERLFCKHRTLSGPGTSFADKRHEPANGRPAMQRMAQQATRLRLA